MLTQSEIDAIKQTVDKWSSVYGTTSIEVITKIVTEERQRAKALLEFTEFVALLFKHQGLGEKARTALNTYNKNKPNDRE